MLCISIALVALLPIYGKLLRKIKTSIEVEDNGKLDEIDISGEEWFPSLKWFKEWLAEKRHKTIRVKLSGTTEFPRLAVYRSTKHIYAQLIDDEKNVTVCSASSVDKDLKEKLAHGGNIEAAKVVGEAIAKKALAAGVECVVFDRGGFLYHGRVAALADAAREAGLMF